MADSIKFSNAAFATQGMLPANDEEVGAIWGRKAANAAARVYGEWSTIVLSTHTSLQNLGVATIVFDSLGFTQWPTVDLYLVRGGSEVVKAPWFGMSNYAPAQGLEYRGVQIEYRDRSKERYGESMLLIFTEADWVESITSRDFTTGTGMQDWGTYLVRLRGN